MMYPLGGVRDTGLANTVACPTCKAGPGADCTKKMTANSPWPYHLPRMKAAVWSATNHS